MNRKSVRGSSMTEYLVVSMVVVAALLLPYVNGQSPVELLVEAIKTNYSGYAWGMSIPI